MNMYVQMQYIILLTKSICLKTVKKEVPENSTFKCVYWMGHAANYTINALHIENRLVLIFTSKIDEKCQISWNFIFFEKACQKITFFFQKLIKKSKTTHRFVWRGQKLCMFFSHSFFLQKSWIFQKYPSLHIDLCGRKFQFSISKLWFFDDFFVQKREKSRNLHDFLTKIMIFKR